jgi:hypothetical protein
MSFEKDNTVNKFYFSKKIVRFLVKYFFVKIYLARFVEFLSCDCIEIGIETPMIHMNQGKI